MHHFLVSEIKLELVKSEKEFASYSLPELCVSLYMVRLPRVKLWTSA